MKKEIIINATSDEIRVALIEENKLAEIFLEVPDKERHVGSIYLGRVERVVQGMNAAFVDIGEAQDAFLHFSDVGTALDEFRDLLDDRDDDEGPDDLESATKKKKSTPRKQPGTATPILVDGGTEQPPDRRPDSRTKPGITSKSSDKDAPGQGDAPRPKEKKRASKSKHAAAPGVDGDETAMDVGRGRSSSNEAAVEPPQPAYGEAAQPEGVAIEPPDAESAGGSVDGELNRKRRRGRRGGRNRKKRQGPPGTGGEALPGDSDEPADVVHPPNDSPGDSPDQEHDSAPANDSERQKKRRRGRRGRRSGERDVVDVAATDTDIHEPSAVPDEKRSNRQEKATPKKPGKQRVAKAKQQAEASDDDHLSRGKSTSSAKARATIQKEAEKSATTAKKLAAGPSKTKKSASKGTAETRAIDTAGVDDESSPSERKGMKKGATRKESQGRRTPSKKKDGGKAAMDAKLPTFQTKRSGEVTIALEKGQDVIVQVTRESYASKGVRVSTKVSLPGRFLVLLPLDPAIGISRKVQSLKERRRLRRIARSILPEGHGCIIRTNAENKDENLIRQDLQQLVDKWMAIEQKVKTADPPMLLYTDQSIANTVMRDLFTPDIDRVVIDNRKLYNEIREYVEWAAPGLAEKVELYQEPVPVFDEFGVERELQKMFERKIYIPAGGYIILDQTEAMMVIDVNSGRYAGKKDQELNSLRTNLESAREIARQIRLRDIGGLLVIDFIDLYDEKNRKKVYDEVKRELKKDRAKSVVLPMTQFGLVQMTRQRIRQQIVQTMSEPCPACNGTGMVQSKSTALRNIERWLLRFKETSKEFRLTLAAHPLLIDHLTEGNPSRLAQVMVRHFVRIKVVPDESVPMGQFHFYSARRGMDITSEYMNNNKKK